MRMCVENYVFLGCSGSKWLFSTHTYRSIAKKNLNTKDILTYELCEMISLAEYFVMGELR